MAMPRMMYGTAWKKERTTELVYQALKAGFRGIDTACQPKHYREDLVGAGIQRAVQEGIIRRDEVFIQTKYTSIQGQDTSQPLPYDPRASIADQVTQSIAKSLANLQVDYIDSVVLHSPLKTREDTLTAYRTLEGFQAQGKIRMLGISNIYDVGLLRWLIERVEVPIGVVQNRSFWTLTGSPVLLQNPLVSSLSRKSAFTPEQTVYRIAQLFGITPLCGSTDEVHMKEALAADTAAPGFGDDDEEAKTIMTLMRGGESG
ncbi:hypothetical protein P7C73_g5412, partial [Tremellales sp. Uapishka_1]